MLRAAAFLLMFTVDAEAHVAVTIVNCVTDEPSVKETFFVRHENGGGHSFARPDDCDGIKLEGDITESAMHLSCSVHQDGTRGERRVSVDLKGGEYRSRIVMADGSERVELGQCVRIDRPS